MTKRHIFPSGREFPRAAAFPPRVPLADLHIALDHQKLIHLSPADKLIEGLHRGFRPNGMRLNIRRLVT
jgi:hypothetical protein